MCGCVEVIVYLVKIRNIITIIERGFAAAVGSLTLDLLARVEWGELDYCLGVHIIKFY